jgi:hypothetical protein
LEKKGSMLPYSSHVCDSAGIVHQLPLVHFDFSQPEMQENMIVGHIISFSNGSQEIDK